jgi:hypothetical protein
MTHKFNNNIDDLPQKRLFLALWPGEQFTPEIWTLSDVEQDFGESGEVMVYINRLEVGESLHETESNIVLYRIPENASTQELMAQLGLTLKD